MKDYASMLEKQHLFFESGQTVSLQFRTQALTALYAAVTQHRERIMQALKEDLNKSAFEAYETEVGMVLSEIRHTVDALPKWAKPRRVRTPLFHFPASGYVYPEPYGSVLIISPWNYPFQLTLMPLIGAIAAGNCAVVKPSEYAPHTAGVLEEILTGLFDPGFVAVVRGGRAENQGLLRQPFDYIFFTGSPAVGRVVMSAAAEHLTPVTLELGGKSPCIVDDTADLRLAARRILWGKLINAGQTCVAPDYLLVHRDVKDALLSEMTQCLRAFWGENPLNNPDYPRIISEKHFDRLCGLMQQGHFVFGGQVNRQTLQIAPAVIEGVNWDSPIMREEIFGPLLPVLTYEDLGDLIAQQRRLPKPLALYLFTTSRDTERRVVRSLSFGGGCINDTIMHLANHHLPFGGIGQSGMGQYHGRASFEAFTHFKGILRKSNRLDIKLRYPPYPDRLGMLEKFLK